jgi:DNA polymerase-3 subunit delta
MPKGAPRALDALLERESPDAVYLILGDSALLKDEAVRAIIDRFADAATRDFNLDLLNGADCDAGRLGSAVDSLPMMATRRVVVLRDFGALKKDARAALDRYLARPSPEVLLVLVSAAGWKPEAAITGHATSIDLVTPAGDALIDWITARAASLGATVDTEAAELLVRATGDDLSLIDGELRKLRDFSGNSPINADAVSAIVGVAKGATADDILDRVCARDGAGAAAIVAAALSQPKASGVGLVLALTTHLVLIGHVLAMRERRAGPGQISKELYAIMGETRSAVVGRLWGAAVTAVIRGADRWDRPGVERALTLLRDADSVLKDTNLSGEERIIETLVLTMCAPRNARGRAA